MRTTNTIPDLSTMLMWNPQNLYDLLTTIIARQDVFDEQVLEIETLNSRIETLKSRIKTLEDAE